jgi:hypothetical protein
MAAIIRAVLFVAALFFWGTTAFASALVFRGGLFLIGLGGCIIFSCPGKAWRYEYYYSRNAASCFYGLGDALKGGPGTG